MMNSCDEPQDLTWLAFRYISDEMTAEEQAAFEERLACDQQAREELAQVVELAQAAAVRPQVVTVTAAHSWSGRLGWMLSGTVACLLLISVVEGWQRYRAELAGLFRGGSDRSLVESLQPEGLALAWASAQSAGETLSVVDSEPTVVAVNEPLEAPVEVPDWLLAAVTAQQQALTPAGSQREEREN